MRNVEMSRKILFDNWIYLLSVIFPFEVWLNKKVFSHIHSKPFLHILLYAANLHLVHCLKKQFKFVGLSHRGKSHLQRFHFEHPLIVV